MTRSPVFEVNAGRNVPCPSLPCCCLELGGDRIRQKPGPPLSHPQPSRAASRPTIPSSLCANQPFISFSHHLPPRRHSATESRIARASCIRLARHVSLSAVETIVRLFWSLPFHGLDRGQRKPSAQRPTPETTRTQRRGAAEPITGASPTSAPSSGLEPRPLSGSMLTRCF